VSVDDDGNGVVTKPGEGADSVLVMNAEGDVRWAGRVPRSEPDAN
jgi:hypothetical protein